MWNKLKAFLLQPTVPLLQYLACAAPLALAGSMVVILSVALMLMLFGVDFESIESPDAGDSILMIALIGPIIETFLLAGGVKLLQKETKLSPVGIATTSAILWGLFHGLFAPIWFFGVVWSFFVFTCGYIAWRKVSLKHALAAAFVPHAVNNSLILLTSSLG